MTRTPVTPARSGGDRADGPGRCSIAIAVVGLFVVVSAGVALAAFGLVTGTDAMSTALQAMFSVALNGAAATIALAWAHRRRSRRRSGS
jgi:hypothetical protein